MESPGFSRGEDVNIQCLTGLAIACRGREGDKAFKRAFILGFGSKVTARMVELSAAQKATLNPDQASRYTLVLRSDADKAQTLLDQVFPSTRATVSRYSNRSAFGAGTAAGARADLGQARMGGGRLAIGT